MSNVENSEHVNHIVIMIPARPFSIAIDLLSLVMSEISPQTHTYTYSYCQRTNWLAVEFTYCNMNICIVYHTDILEHSSEIQMHNYHFFFC